jgi:triosephosphate isomerase
MAPIFANLKRFDVPRELGGVCRERDPSKWAGDIIRKIVEIGLGKHEKVHLTLLLPASAASSPSPGSRGR